MSEKKSILILFSIVVMLLLSSIVLAANGYRYVAGVEPHTRYNPNLNDCYYYYGYGSCTVAKTQCQGVAVGKDKWIDLGDACKRNVPPVLTTRNNSNQYASTKTTIYINILEDITVYEGQKVVINMECIDEDPVKISYEGWTTTKITQTDYNDAGFYTQKVICEDSFKEKATGEFKITIIEQNRPPLFKLFDWSTTKPKTNNTTTNK